MGSTLSKPSARPWLAAAIAALLLGSVGTYVVLSSAFNRGVSPDPTTEIAPARAVTALGRLEPQGEVVKLSVPNAADSRVNQILVEEGDWVDAEEIIAVLQGLDKKQAELAAAQQNAAIYWAKQVQARTGEAKLADIAAQQAVLTQLASRLQTETAERQAEQVRAQAALQNAEQNYYRYEQLHQQGAVETAVLDDRREVFETAQASLNVAKARLANTVSTLQAQLRQEQALLARLQEVRPVDLQVAQAELNYAIAQVKRIEAELEDLYVRVPRAGQILKINTHIGEQVNISEGIVELGQTNQMTAIAKVYETDVSLVQLGQRATIVSEHGGFEGEIHGVVEQIGMQINKQDVLGADPAADKDARVVEVKVRIDPEDNDKVAALTNLQVRIEIDLERPLGEL
ncbi:ABC exporter membrane fusion protein, DevB family [Synechococcus sp. PCC 7335]|uniref:HlyD family efflux transporter periplasmic adaptor subunit n=1 Tax=Synechococcus sp. (strain ATCC 29403 / PCC 7335) TaxID=91464 RepID=UPI00017EC7EA|nr:HlyD family efflux transporter periplasmic adaptor subunit [Synechococcus sp. PCC 7335]EDX83203.1 ABC exporter membrane fusion protein, DevB family [Synechococcus sp. PCC 7335]